VTLRNPLLAWLRRLDPRLVDGLLVAALAAAVLVQQLHLNPGHVYRPAMAVVGGVLPLLWRRRYPLAAHLLVIAALVAGGQQPVTASLFATFVGFYSVAAYSRWRVPAVVLPMLGALTLWLLVPLSHPSIPAWGLELTGGLGVWVIGNSVASLRTRAFSLEERALRVERERELSTQLALAGERARISRELHDIVAHSVSVISVQANVARKLMRKDPDSAAAALVSVEGSAREALSELRSLLGLLGEGSDAELGPQPGIDQLGLLVRRVGAAGLPVRLEVAGRARPLPPGLDLAAYRIVQEALTNSLRYAHGADTRVSVAYDDSELRLAIVNEPGGAAAGPAGSGRGLLGLKERASIYGGEVEAGRRPEGGFAVRARLPLLPA